MPIFDPAIFDPAIFDTGTAHQTFTYDVGQTAASQAVTYDVTAPFTTAVQSVRYDVLGWQAASIATTYDVGSTGSSASQAVTFDIISTVGSETRVGVYLGGQTWTTGIRVHSKAGAYIDTIGGPFSMGPRPKSVLNWRGIHSDSLTLTLPRVLTDTDGTWITNPELTLIDEDRILAIGNSLMADVWAYSVKRMEWTDGALIVTMADLYDQLTTAIVKSADEILTRSGNNAASVVRIVMERANAWLGREGEVQWEVDATGSSTVYFDDKLSGDALSMLGRVASRSFTEGCYDARIEATRIVPIMRWRDEFTAAAGVDLTDGDDGNVRAGVSLATSVEEVVNAIRITGAVTRIESLIPPGAVRLPVQETLPVAEVWRPTGTLRRRTNLSLSAPVTLEINVPYTLPDEDQQELADDADKQMRLLFRSFIRAVHDQYGRPWHDGWAWSGGQVHGEGILDDDVLERVIHLKDYVHWLHLAKGPAAIVMKHRSLPSYVRVTYDRVEGVQTVARTSQSGEIDPATVFDFEWRRYAAGEWDPRRDGVGRLTSVRTVIAGAVATVEAYRIVPYGLGDKDYTSSLIHGVTAAATDFPIQNALGYPAPPFEATVGYDEIVNVTAISGNILTVVRAQHGTIASIHEAGEPVTYTAPASEADEEPPVDDTLSSLPILEVPWPDGEAYANALLDRLADPRQLLPIHLANIEDDWATVAIGSTHDVDVQTEGPSGGIVGTVRVVGFAPWELGPSATDGGSVELLVEVQ